MKHPAITLRALALGLAIVAGSARAGGTPLGELALTNTVYTSQEVDATVAGKAATNHGHRLEYNYPYLYTDLAEGTMFKANNKNEVVPAVAGTDYVVPANLAAVATAATNYTDAAIAAATPAAPTWNTAAVGANPTVALAVAANTAYKRTGTGTLTLSAVTGLSADPTYCIFSGFGSLVLPPGFAAAGSGSFRSGKENHLAFWSTPTTNVVNFLFAQ